MADHAATTIALAVPYYLSPGGAGPGAPGTPSFGSPSASGPATSRSAWTPPSFGKSLAAVRGEAPGDLIFGRVVLIPSLLSVGNVTDLVQVSAILWNAQLVDRATLLLVEAAGDDGIVRSGIAPAESIGALRDLTVDYDVDVDGPIVIDATFRYVFDEGSEPVQRIVGSRGAVLLSRPLASGYAEIWSYATEVVRALDGSDWASSKFAAGSAPRLAIRLPVSTFGRRDLARLRNALRFGSRFNLAAPLWWSLSRLTADADGSNEILLPTAERRFVVGGNVLLLSDRAPVEDRFALRLIESIEADRLVLNAPVDAEAFLAGDLALPVVAVAPPEEHELSSVLSGYARGELELRELN